MNLEVFVFIGPPGGGKGYLSSLLVDRLGWKQLSTGNLLREHISNQTEIGKKIDFIIKSGKLISDDLITDMVGDWLSSNLNSKTPIILDGYPRTVVQAKALNDLLETKFPNIRLNLVKLLVDENTLIERLSSRLVCSNPKCQAGYSSSPKFSPLPSKSGICDKCGSSLMQRADDKEDAIKQRLLVYNNHEKELLDYYFKNNQKIVQINSQRPIEDVFKEFNELFVLK